MWASALVRDRRHRHTPPRTGSAKPRRPRESARRDSLRVVRGPEISSSLAAPFSTHAPIVDLRFVRGVILDTVEASWVISLPTCTCRVNVGAAFVSHRTPNERCGGGEQMRDWYNRQTAARSANHGGTPRTRNLPSSFVERTHAGGSREQRGR